MPNYHILINFKDKKVIHTEEHEGSEDVAKLKQQGYEVVGESKEGKSFFWKPEYFDPKVKRYPTKKIDSISAMANTHTRFNSAMKKAVKRDQDRIR